MFKAILFLFVLHLALSQPQREQDSNRSSNFIQNYRFSKPKIPFHRFILAFGGVTCVHWQTRQILYLVKYRVHSTLSFRQALLFNQTCSIAQRFKAIGSPDAEITIFFTAKHCKLQDTIVYVILNKGDLGQLNWRQAEISDGIFRRQIKLHQQNKLTLQALRIKSIRCQFLIKQVLVIEKKSDSQQID